MCKYVFKEYKKCFKIININILKMFKIGYRG